MATLHTDRLVLRRAELSDIDALHEVFSDPRAMRYWSTLPHTEIEQTQAFVEAMQGLYDQGGSEYVVEHDGRAVGKAGVWAPPEIGFIFHPSIWGKGLASEATSAVIQQVFTATDLDHITADVDPRNARSIRLLERLGFTETGRAEATLTLGDEVCDSIYFALPKPNSP